MSRPVCAVDTETTGLHWEREAWELALIRRDESGLIETVCCFLDVDLSKADAKALEIGGYYSRHPFGKWLTDHEVKESGQTPVGRLFGEYHPGPDGDTYLFADHAVRIIQRMTHGATIVGAQPHFDTHILERLMRGNALLPSWHHRLCDVESLTAGHLGREVGGLAACADALGIDFPDQHTALGDARCALAIYDKIIGGPS